MKKTIGWAAVGQDGKIFATDEWGFGKNYAIYTNPEPGLVRVEIRECREKKRKVWRKK